MNKVTKIGILVLVLVIIGTGVIVAKDKVAENSEPLVSNIFYDTFIIDALNDISAQTGVPIITDSTVSGYITLDLKNVPLEGALKRICLPYGYTFRYMEEGYYFVGSADPESPTFPLLSKVEVIETSYFKAEIVSKLLSEFYQPYIEVDKETNTLVITASPEIIKRAQAAIAKIDKHVPQVMLEVVVSEVTNKGREILGTDWQWQKSKNSTAKDALNYSIEKFSSNISLSYTDSLQKFLMSLQSLVEKGEANIHANPRIVTMDGRPADIFLGNEQSYVVLTDSQDGSSTSREVVTVKSGVTLEFLPHISPGDKITVEVKPEVSTVTGTNSSGYPIVSRRKANTTLRLQDGETFVLGGLLQELETNTVAKVPLLGDIPLLGKIFRKKVLIFKKQRSLFL